MITADTSVVVPALLDGHDHHEIARPATASVVQLPAHVLAESYSVLTRLPRGLSLAPDVAAALLLESFPGPRFVLGGAAHRDLLHALSTAGVRGGAVHDAVVAATAAGADAELLTLDGRAVASYRAVDVRFRAPA